MKSLHVPFLLFPEVNEPSRRWRESWLQLQSDPHFSWFGAGPSWDTGKCREGLWPTWQEQTSPVAVLPFESGLPCWFLHHLGQRLWLGGGHLLLGSWVWAAGVQAAEALATGVQASGVRAARVPAAGALAAGASRLPVAGVPAAGCGALTALVLLRLRQLTSGAQRRLLPGWSTSVCVSIRTPSHGTTSGAPSSCTWSGGTSRYFTAPPGYPHLASPQLGLGPLPLTWPASDCHSASETFVHDWGSQLALATGRPRCLWQ